MNKLYIFWPGLQIQGKKIFLKALFLFILDMHYSIPFLAYFELAEFSVFFSLTKC